MKATELMIGDWLKCSDPTPFRITDIETEKGTSYFRVTGDDGWVVDGGELEPIPLTAEILEKNGFLIIGNNASYKEAAEYYGKAAVLNVVYHKLSGHLHIQRMVYYYIGREQHEDWCNLLHIHTLYVHELQHALRLCGIEKEIEL